MKRNKIFTFFSLKKKILYCKYRDCKKEGRKGEYFIINKRKKILFLQKREISSKKN